MGSQYLGKDGITVHCFHLSIPQPQAQPLNHHAHLVGAARCMGCQYLVKNGIAVDCCHRISPQFQT